MADQELNRRGGQKLGDSKFASYIPITPPPLAKAYKGFYNSLTPEQLKMLGGKPDPRNLTDEIRPQTKNATNPDDWDYFTDGSAGQPQTNLFGKALCHYDPEPIEPDAQNNSKPNHIHLIVLMEVLRKVLKVYEVASDPSTRLHGEVVAVALGFPGMTVGSLAKAYGCTRQAVSKRLRRVITALDLPPTYRMVVHSTQPTHLTTMGKAGCSYPKPTKRGPPSIKPDKKSKRTRTLMVKASKAKARLDA